MSDVMNALIQAMRAAAKLDLSDSEVQQDLKSLFDDPATAFVMGSLHDRIRRSEIAAGRNRLARAIGCDLWDGGPFRFRKNPKVPDLAIYRQLSGLEKR